MVTPPASQRNKPVSFCFAADWTLTCNRPEDMVVPTSGKYGRLVVHIVTPCNRLHITANQSSGFCPMCLNPSCTRPRPQSADITLGMAFCQTNLTFFSLANRSTKTPCISLRRDGGWKEQAVSAGSTAALSGGEDHRVPGTNPPPLSIITAVAILPPPWRGWTPRG